MVIQTNPTYIGQSSYLFLVHTTIFNHLIHYLYWLSVTAIKIIIILFNHC